MAPLPDRLREMEVFITVLDEGSFSAAAQVLALTASGVSRTIDRLEARLAVRLLIRSTRALRLTSEGEAFAYSARRILSAVDQAEEQLGAGQCPSGLLRVSAAVSHGRLKIVPLLGEFSRIYPAIRLDMTLTDLLEDPATGRTDVAIRFGKLSDSSLIARKLADEPMITVAAPAYIATRGTPRHPDDLRQHDCLLFSFDPGRARWAFDTPEGPRIIQVGGKFRANSGEALGMLAVSGLGVARVARFAVEEDLAEGRLCEILQDYPVPETHHVHALFLGGPTLPARVRVFVDFLVDRLRAG
ncbi:LysR family transcriptional regulator (plasmid) [Thioclava sp. 'Guangxiensis']|uniref:LysR family transcriptional regulator n=1 Tax=Thioclava sp. 'Guangxiensis' TaxID=3149044 RepID=UPI0032C47A97